MNYLFIHQNFPGQYQHLVRHLASQPGNTVNFVTQPNQNEMRGVNKIVYRHEMPSRIACHPFTLELDIAVRIGIAAAQACQDLKNSGFAPDVIVGHNGWGEMLFVKDVFPDVPTLAYFEFFYHAHGVDVGFDPEYPAKPSDPHLLRIRNAVNYIGLDSADWGNTATRWQRSLYPPEARARITALHEGVDTERVRPDPDAWIRLARNDMILSRRDEVITFVARGLEPYRGFHILMRALPELQKRRPKAQVVIVGSDDVSYGSRLAGGASYRQMLLRELGNRVDYSRVHFLGQVDYAAYLNVLQVSSVHVYLTYPFVLSWSFIEALAAGCLVVGSATAPVLEVLRHGENGLTTDFFSTGQLCDRIDEVLEHPDRMADLRAAARETAMRGYDLRVVLPRWLKLVEDVRIGRQPMREAAE